MVYRKYIRKYRRSRKRSIKNRRRRRSRSRYGTIARIAKSIYNKNVETKTIDVQFDQPLNVTGDYWVPIVPWNRNNSGLYEYHLEIPQGTGDGDRLGRKIKLTGIMVDVVFFLAANGGAAGSQQQCRFVMGFMTASGDSVSAQSSMLNTSQAYYKKLDSVYLVVKKDVKFTLDQNPLNQGEILQYRVKRFIKLEQTLEYDLSDTPTSYKGVPIVCVSSERAMSTGINVTYRGYVRYYYQDP